MSYRLFLLLRYGSNYLMETIVYVDERTEEMTKPYEVCFFKPDNPTHLEQWLQNILLEENLRLIACTGDYWIFEYWILETKILETDNSSSFAVDAMESYGEFYDKAVCALGFPSATLPCQESNDMMLKRIGDLFWAARVLSRALQVTYEKVPNHLRDALPFSYNEIMSKVKWVLK